MKNWFKDGFENDEYWSLDDKFVLVFDVDEKRYRIIERQEDIYESVC